MSRLLVTKGTDEGKEFELDQPILSIGRDAANTISLHDTEVSRQHAELRRQLDGFQITDIGSANGTFVNGKRIQSALLQPGDQIIVGQTTFLYSGSRSEVRSNLADKISMISRGDVPVASVIVKTIAEQEGSRILSHSDQSSPWLKNALSSLSTLYETSQAISHILDLNELLKRILELVFRNIDADRGCIMLANTETRVLEPQALRFRNESEASETFPVSRSIMDHVLKEKEGVLLSDAARDERFVGGQSIVRSGIREVICVPMKGRHETMGVLYLDTYTSSREVITGKGQGGKFTSDHLSLAIAIAHQAALAVEETRYHQALLQAERLAAIGQTIAALSHHIKNILQGLRSGSEIIQMGLKDGNNVLVEKGWRIAEKNQGKIYSLVMDMLSYSKERVPSVEATNLNDIIRDVCELMAGRAKDLNARLESRPAPDLPIVQVDAEGLHRALLNVVSNAIDAVEDRPDALVTVDSRVSREDDTVRIVVMDNGVGIPPDKIEEIFKPFVSTKGSKGTGLGLAVSRKLLREHGGDILVQSQLGVGSKFTLRVPTQSPFAVEPARAGDEMVRPPDEE